MATLGVVVLTVGTVRSGCAPYFHDGSAATLADVVVHYNRVRSLGFTTEQQSDLVEYLKSR